MKTKLLILLILFVKLLNSQTIVNYETFANLRGIKVLSTQTIDSVPNIGKCGLRVKFIDYNDSLVKIYDAILGKNEFISFSSTRTILGSLKGFSVMTVPIKIRTKNEDGFVTAQADLKNVGLYFPIKVKEIKRVWIDNSTSNHKISFGFLIAPMVEVLSDKNTNNYFNNADVSYSAMMLSTSFGCTYTYKSITLAAVMGMDNGLDEASKNWVNDRKWWFGLGFGIDTKFFGF
jgi:hypothetical protein